MFNEIHVAILSIKILVIVCLGLILTKMIASFAKKFFAHRLSAQAGLLVHKAIIYLGMSLIILLSLHELGIKISVLLGAAGVMGVAIGFASQTSASNIISGWFLLAEMPFKVGSTVEVNGKLGVIESIDLLSVKLKTFDNRLIRIPNESLLKTEVTNITHFPMRRLDMTIGVAYKENLDHVITVLKDIIAQNEFILEDPEPLVRLNEFGASSLDLFVAVWFQNENLGSLKSTFLKSVKERFDQEGIEIPFPHVSIYAGEVTKPLPIYRVGSVNQ